MSMAFFIIAYVFYVLQRNHDNHRIFDSTINVCSLNLPVRDIDCARPMHTCGIICSFCSDWNEDNYGRRLNVARHQFWLWVGSHHLCTPWISDRVFNFWQNSQMQQMHDFQCSFTVASTQRHERNTKRNIFTRNRIWVCVPSNQDKN